MTIWMVTGLHEERWAENVSNNFVRQTYRDRELIVVVNGRAGHGQRLALPHNCIILGSQPGPAHAMNRGLEWLRNNARFDDWFCKCDADDYYGPEYLQSVSDVSRSGADFAGRHSVYLRTPDNKLWFLEGTATTVPFHGPTLAARLDSALDFPREECVGEDQLWCKSMTHKGRRGVVIEPAGFCYQRWANYAHAWLCTDEELRSAWPVPFQALGDFNEDVVNGIRSKRNSTESRSVPCS